MAMIQQFVSRWEERKGSVTFDAHPEDYKALVVKVIELLTLGEDGYEDFNPDPKRITEIDDGDYQGTLVYVIGEHGYQPSVYYWVMVSYGSCSGCDTLQAIRDDYDYSVGDDDYDKAHNTVNDRQRQSYLTLMLHIVQGLRRISKYGEE